MTFSDNPPFLFYFLHILMEKNLVKSIKIFLIIVLIVSFAFYSYLIYNSISSIFSVIKNLKINFTNTQDGTNITFSTKNEGKSYVNLNLNFELYLEDRTLFSKNLNSKIESGKEFNDYLFINFSELISRINNFEDLNKIKYKIIGNFESDYLKINIKLV